VSSLRSIVAATTLPRWNVNGRRRNPFTRLHGRSHVTWHRVRLRVAPQTLRLLFRRTARLVIELLHRLGWRSPVNCRRWRSGGSVPLPDDRPFLDDTFGNLALTLRRRPVLRSRQESTSRIMTTHDVAEYGKLFFDESLVSATVVTLRQFTDRSNVNAIRNHNAFGSGNLGQ